MMQNILVVGQAGVGKSMLIRGLCQRIEELGQSWQTDEDNGTKIVGDSNADVYIKEQNIRGDYCGKSSIKFDGTTYDVVYEVKVHGGIE